MSKKEGFSCFFCDYWWLFLIFLMLIAASLLTRRIWEPYVFDPAPTAVPLSTVTVLPTSTPMPTVTSTLTATPTNPARQSGTPQPYMGFLAPDFTLSTLGGEMVTLSNLRGKKVVLNIWASWCQPCQDELPAFQRLWQEYQERELVVLAVNSTVQDNSSDVRSFVTSNGLTFPIPLDTNGVVTSLYQVNNLPTTFFIGADGVIREVVIGSMDEEILRNKVEQLLREAR